MAGRKLPSNNQSLHQKALFEWPAVASAAVNERLKASRSESWSDDMSHGFGLKCCWMSDGVWMHLSEPVLIVLYWCSLVDIGCLPLRADQLKGQHLRAVEISLEYRSV